MTSLELALTLQGDLDAQATVDVARLAEAAGFSHLWQFDSSLQWREPYPLLTLVAAGTATLRLGTCVTNPRTRHPTVTAALLATLAELSGGRVDLGIGRGDSAVRMFGDQPASVAELERAIREIRALAEGREVQYTGGPQRLAYAVPHPLPVWVAGYGPRVLDLAGRVADGVILQLADAPLVGWLARQVRDAAERAGRDPATIRIQVAAPAVVDDDPDVRRGLRWFPALVANHVIDLLRRADPHSLPRSLVEYVDTGARYDYIPQHTGDYGFVSDETVDRFCITGGPGAHVDRIAALRQAGMTQLNVYAVPGREAETVAAYAALGAGG